MFFENFLKQAMEKPLLGVSEPYSFNYIGSGKEKNTPVSTLIHALNNGADFVNGVDLITSENIELLKKVKEKNTFLITFVTSLSKGNWAKENVFDQAVSRDSEQFEEILSYFEIRAARYRDSRPLWITLSSAQHWEIAKKYIDSFEEKKVPFWFDIGSIGTNSRAISCPPICSLETSLGIINSIPETYPINISGGLTLEKEDGTYTLNEIFERLERRVQSIVVGSRITNSTFLEMPQKINQYKEELICLDTKYFS